MHRWFFSLQFRLMAAFALVLGLTLSSTSLYSAHATRRELAQFEQELEAAREERLREVITSAYQQRADWSALQVTLEQAGALMARRVVVLDESGRLVADSHSFTAGPFPFTKRDLRRLPIWLQDERVGMIVVEPDPNYTTPDHILTVHGDATGVGGVVTPVDPRLDPRFQPRLDPRLLEEEARRIAARQEDPTVEPQFSKLAASFNRSLLWAGIVAGGTGVAAIAITTGTALAPVRALTRAARKLGAGELSERVEVSQADEVGQLATTFNDMAEGLQHAEEQRRTLAADVAHELRTPISNLQGYLEAIKDGVLQPEPATIENLYQQVRHLGRLVEDLRMLALAEAGSLPLSLAPEKIEEIVNSTVDAFRPRAAEKGVQLVADHAGDLPAIEVDRTRISQVLANLIENAITHTPEGGSVEVTVDRTPDAVRIAVTDTGVGIPAESLPLIFERFYRVDPSRSRTTGGAGLGLTIVKRLVEMHGGTVWAESEVGQGSTFTVELPLKVD